MVNKGNEENITKVYHTNEDKHSQSSCDKGKELVPTYVWLPLALFAGVLYAIVNIVKMELSKYGFSARYLQAPGSLIANMITLTSISIDCKFKAKGTEDPKAKESSYFDWFWEILSTNSNKSKVDVSKVLAICTLITINIFGYWAVIESYKIATRININTGILTSLFVFKPVITSVLFFLIFGQRLKWGDIVSISFILMIVFHVILLNNDAMSNGMFDEFSFDLLKAILLMLFTIVLLSCSNTINKYYFASGNSKRNIFIITSVVNFTISFPMTLYGIYMYTQGFEFTNFDLLLGTFGGLINYFASSLWGFVVTHGKAGLAEAAMQSCFVFQTWIEAILYGRIPHILMYFFTSSN